MQEPLETIYCNKSFVKVSTKNISFLFETTEELYTSNKMRILWSEVHFKSNDVMSYLADFFGMSTWQATTKYSEILKHNYTISDKILF